MDELLTNGERLKKFLKDSLGWLILGMAIAGVGWKIQLNRTEQLELQLTESQKNERLLQGKIISCKEEAQKDALQSVYENMEMIKKMQEVMNRDNNIKEELIKQSKVRQKSYENLNKQLDKIIRYEIIFLIFLFIFFSFF